MMSTSASTPDTRAASRSPVSRLGVSLVLLAVSAAVSGGDAAPETGADHKPATEATDLGGLNPHPVALRRPAQRPETPLARLGKAVFFDTRLSISGQQSCVSCHSPTTAFGPPDGKSVQLGGPELKSQGLRAVPGLTYLEAVPSFGIALDSDDSESGEQEGETALRPGERAQPATVGATSKAQAAVPLGGLFWDGRANTLIAQAAGPLMNPFEMGNTSLDAIAAKLKAAPYAAQFVAIDGAGVLNDPHLLATDAMYAVSRYQLEDLAFHSYTSKFDYWLEGRARFTPAEMRGYAAFNDPKVGNCAACHVDTVRRNGEAPLFTDYQFEALGVPRNAELAANRDPAYFDLGLCGPIRVDLKTVSAYCGMFRTPTLRNVALRKVFFHNGRYHALQDVLAFYNFRETAPGKVYPRLPDGSLARYDDLPKQYRTNIDIKDAPFDRHPGDAPAMSEQDMQDIIAFLGTLTDGYKPGGD